MESPPLQVTFDDVLIVPRYSSISSRDEVSLFQENVLLNHSFDIPFISSNMDTITEYDMASFMAHAGGLGIWHRYMSVREAIEVYEKWSVNELNPLAISIGCLKKDKTRIDALLEYGSPSMILCIDTAHGDSINMKQTLNYIRNDRNFKGAVIAGNVCTPQGTQRLLDWGADMVKVGIGPGSVCTTRIKTGCGYPQFSAIMKCSKVGPIIADGGISKPADACKALAAGAKMVMLGGMLAGTDKTPSWESASEDIEFRGMASKEAREAFEGVSKNAEGVSCMIKAKPKGSTRETINWLVEGLKSSLSYVGASTLDEFRKSVSFVQVTSNVIVENGSHIKD